MLHFTEEKAEFCDEASKNCINNLFLKFGGQVLVNLNFFDDHVEIENECIIKSFAYHFEEVRLNVFLFICLLELG